MEVHSELVAPRARTDGLLVREVDSETIIFDRGRNEAHCLSPIAALVWKHADGQTTIEELGERVGRELHEHVDQQRVWEALLQLAQYDLLEEQVSRPAAASSITRRDMMVKVGVAAAVGVPLISSILVPTSAYATTCSGACTTTANCVSGCTCRKALPSNGMCASGDLGCTCRL